MIKEFNKFPLIDVSKKNITEKLVHQCFISLIQELSKSNQSPVLSSPVLTQMLSIIDLSFYLLTSCNTDIWISCEKQRLWKCYFVEQICRKRRCRKNQGQIILMILFGLFLYQETLNMFYDYLFVNRFLSIMHNSYTGISLNDALHYGADQYLVSERNAWTL